MAAPPMIHPTGIGLSGSLIFRIGVGVSSGRGPKGRSSKSGAEGVGVAIASCARVPLTGSNNNKNE